MHLRRLAVLLVPIALGLFSAALPGRAQTSDSRYAFADTTLLRDTLGLSFEGIFPLADSLRVTPDTLRALSIRYRAPLWRIVRLADSLGMSPDSVTAVLERERLNPLAANRKDVTTFSYSSTYGFQQTSAPWSNSMNWRRDRGPLFMTNQTQIDLTRYTAGGITTTTETRNSNTEAAWRFSPGLSLGGRLGLYRYNDVSTTDDRTDLQLALRTRQKPTKGMTSEFDFYSGLLDNPATRQVKRGWSNVLNGHFRYTRGTTLSSDMSGSLSGNLARTRLPSATEALTTRDFSRNLNGTLGLFTASPISANLSYRVRRSRVETAQLAGLVQQVINENDGADLTLRGRLDNDRQLNVTGRYGTTKAAQANSLTSLSTGRTLALSVDGRYSLFGILLESQFENRLVLSEFPRRATDSGYGDSTHTRSLKGSASRLLGQRVTLRASGDISLTSDRYYLIGPYQTPLSDRDAFRQTYRLATIYSVSQDLNTDVAIEVGRSHTINIRQASSGTNSETRSYRGNWHWAYRLLPDLTADQVNTVSADYLRYDYRAKDNRLTLYYQSTTTLSATLSPRFNFRVTHGLGYQPSGNYTLQPDGLEALTRSDESRSYTLRTQFNYLPTPGVSFTLTPSYIASDRKNAVAGTLVPQRRDRTFDLQGGVNLNLAIGTHGRLTGDVGRSYRAARAVTWAGDFPVTGARTGSDFWNGSLALSWEL